MVKSQLEPELQTFFWKMGKYKTSWYFFFHLINNAKKRKGFLPLTVEKGKPWKVRTRINRGCFPGISAWEPQRTPGQRLVPHSQGWVSARVRLSTVPCLFTDRRESRGPCSDGTPSARHARKRREKAIVSDLGVPGPRKNGGKPGASGNAKPPVFTPCLGNNEP